MRVEPYCYDNDGPPFLNKNPLNKQFESLFAGNLSFEDWCYEPAYSIGNAVNFIVLSTRSTSPLA